MSEIDELKALIAEQAKTIEQLQALVRDLQDANRRLLRWRFGQRNEKSIETGQTLIELDGLTCDVDFDASAAGVPDSVIPARTLSAQRKRQLWSEICPNVDVQEHLIELPADERFDVDGTPLVKMGAEMSEELVYTPGTVHIVRTIRQRYGRSDTAEKVAIAPVPARIVPGGALANESILAMVVHHAMDCLPYQRIAEMITRLSAPVNRALVTHACNTYAKLAEPMLDAMQEQILQTDVLHIDGSFLFHQDRKRKRRCSRKPLYALSDGQQVVMRWRDDERHATAQNLIPGYHGYLVHDEWEAWYGMQGAICTHVACHAHARRYFAQTQDIDSDARTIIALYTDIYAVECRATESGLTGQALTEYRLTLRQRHTKPLFDKLFACAEDKARQRTGTARTAFRYFARHREPLSVCLTDGIVPLDNNLAERLLRRNAMLRKNRLFYVGADCGQHIGTLLSLMVTCRELDIQPLDYLKWSLPALLDYRDRQDTIMQPDLTAWTPLAYQAYVQKNILAVA